MASYDIDLLHQRILRILMVVDKTCRENQLRYYIWAGTMIGAVRHKGFIPWDDDIDIAMPLSDFKIFSNLIIKDEKFLEKYNVYGSYGDYKSFDIWIKIVRKRTAYFEKECLKSKIDKGVSLDIYPLIGEYDGKIAKYLQSKAIKLQHNIHLLQHAKMTDYYFVRDPKIKKFAKDIGFFPDFLPNFMINAIKTLFWPDPVRCKMAGTIDFAPFKGKFEYKKCTEIIEGIFEDDKYPIPKDYDYFLKEMYWNYMELPPEDKRGSHHSGNVYFAYDMDVAEEAGLQI